VTFSGTTAIESQLIDGSQPARPPRDLQRTFLLLLATLWLFDAVLQLQPFMFTKGADGFSGMLRGLADGNPGWVADSIRWNASIVAHQPILTNAAFAGIQFLIAFGIVYRRTTTYALGVSIAWSLNVWWFGEGAGGIFQGGATPFGGGPGGVLCYALLAILLWPSDGTDQPFVAAKSVGVRAAKVIWIVWWAVLALLSVVGAGRSPQALHDLVDGMMDGEPGWLAHIDRVSESFLLHHGTAAAICLAGLCVAVAVSVLLPARVMRVILVIAITVFVIIWFSVQNLGGILVGGATDPNSGPAVILLLLLYWPRTDEQDLEPAVAMKQEVAL